MTLVPSIDELFESRVEFPDPDRGDRLNRLVGLEAQASILRRTLGLMVNPARLDAWAKLHHPEATTALDYLRRRPSLVVLAGDVGTGKTELAETIGDAVARQEDIPVTLYPLSLSTRGQGRVGEMTQLLTASFDHVIEEARKLQGESGNVRGAAILLIDEADALAQSREGAQMHHEDRAGVNAFIRGVDRLTSTGLPAAVIMCTNRLSALDPAVKRRAASILTFARPDCDQRRAVLAAPLEELGFTPEDIEAVVTATGSQPARPYGFTYSDLTQRLLPSILLDAYPDGPVDALRAVEIAGSLVPTAPFQDGES